MTYVGEATRLEEQEQARFEARATLAHYQSVAREAAMPQILDELEAARSMLRWGVEHELVLVHVSEALRLLGPRPAVQEDHDLVLDRLPSGELAWLKADLTVKP